VSGRREKREKRRFADGLGYTYAYSQFGRSDTAPKCFQTVHHAYPDHGQLQSKISLTPVVKSHCQRKLMQAHPDVDLFCQN
jgi:hypothetical protein